MSLFDYFTVFASKSCSNFSVVILSRNGTLA